ncbi:MAG: YdeI/OmpD-associated family protein [Acidobacteria bacterium]|nr:YdeI/OmpD-associated family protein [Acidobacteriota bacterium]
MGKKDSRVDAYIAKSPAFAKPILTELREVVHDACPDCEETLKWSSPTFLYKGMLCGMSAFKEHAAFGFWKGSLVVKGPKGENAFRVFGKLTKLSDLPSRKTLSGYIKKAMALNDAGVTIKRAPKGPAKPLTAPKDLVAALGKNKKAKATFEAFSTSHKNEYIEWITGAKQEETRTRRLQKAVAQMAEGKPHNWKYMKCKPA